MSMRSRTSLSARVLAVLAVACTAVVASDANATVGEVADGADATKPAVRSLEPIAPGGSTPDLPRTPTDPAVYTVDLARFGVSSNGTSPVATAEGLDDAFEFAAANGYDTVRLPTGKYLIGKPGNDIYYDGIDLVSGLTLDLNGSTLQMATNDKWNQCLISVTGLTDVTIRNGTLIGDRDTHIFTPRAGGGTAHDEGHLICVQSGSRRILIEDLTLRKATGDGILLVGNRSNGSVSDITIRNNEIDNSRRQGVSIVGAINVLIDGNEIHHIVGTSPQFGIDVESLSFDSRDIIIRNNDFHHNFGGDIVNTDGKNVLIEYNTFNEGDGNRNLDGPIVFWPRADQTIRHNTLYVRTGSVNGKVGIIGYSGRDRAERSNPATNWIYDNYCDGCGFYIYNTTGFRVMRNTFENGYIAMRDVDDVVLLDNEVSYPSSCWPYRFLRVDGFARGNTHNGDAKSLPMRPGTLWDGCWIN